MKKQLLASAALIVGAALAAPASASIFLDAFVTYDKFVTVNETLTKDKQVTLDVLVTLRDSTAAESNAVINQRIGGEVPLIGGGPNISSYVSVDLSGLFGFGGPIDYEAVTFDSVLDNFGIVQYNQDVGTGSNQQNSISAAVGAFAAFAEANNSAAQYIEGNIVTEAGRQIGTTSIAQVIRSARLDQSVLRNQGVVMVNQNAGVFNNQLNTASLAVGFNPGAVALAESDLGQWNTGNITVESGVSREARIVDSVNSNTGIVAGNQAAGYLANQGNMVSVAATFPNPGLGTAIGSGLGQFTGSLPPNFP